MFSTLIVLPFSLFLPFLTFSFAFPSPFPMHHHHQHLQHRQFHQKHHPNHPRSTNQFVLPPLAVKTINDQDGVGAGSPTYKLYTGDGSEATGWPGVDQWASFHDLWTNNLPIMKQSCGWNGWGADNSDAEIEALHTSLQQVSSTTGIDHRLLLSLVLQESRACVRVPTTNNGVRNPGLLQSHNGAHSCNDPAAGIPAQNPCPNDQIAGMLMDGAGGTESGDGVAGLINRAVAMMHQKQQSQTTSGQVESAQAFYMAARMYNSGSLSPDGDLGKGLGSTNCYVSDVVNRVMGWRELESASTCNL